MQGTCHIIADPFGALHGTARDVQTLLLSGFGGQLVQFGDRVAQKFLFLTRGLQGRLGIGQHAGGLAAGDPCGANRRQIQRPETVQQQTVTARVQQAAIVVLAVKFDQNFGQLPQNLA